MSTSPVRCSHFTLGNPKKSCSILLIHTSDYLRYLKRKQTVTHLAATRKNVTTLTCEMQSFFVLLKVCCVPTNVGSSEKNTLCVGIGGSGKNRLWCVATGILDKQCHNVGCRVAQLVKCLVTSGYPDGSSSGGPGSNPGENENFWKIPRITWDATTLA